MNFNLVFALYSCLLGFLVGALASLFLALSNLLIHLVWTTVPEQLDTSLYPFWICLFGGLLIGLFQTYIGDYPRTMHQTLEEFKTTGRVTYEGAVVKNTVAALLVLTFGASLGPEAALISILGGLMTWVGDRMTWTLQKKEQLLELGIGAMLSTIFYAPLIGVSEAFEDGVTRANFKHKSVKIVLYGLTTACGIFAFTTINRLFPHEVLFSISTPKVNWTWEVLYFLIPAILIGTGFGYLFLLFGHWLDAVARKYPHPMGLAVTAGAVLGLFGTLSSYFLFSGEHKILEFSRIAFDQSVFFLISIAVGKAFLTHVCFSFGWRGGKIFPAVFSSTAMAFVLASFFPYTPGLLIAVSVAASCTVILKQPFVTATLLLFLFPLQFFPFILLVAVLIKQLSVRLEGRA
ncbi:MULTISPECIES: chloride channel protein [Exiguobacterium]|uniref:chloride channel protein n=1 Tax=Exiguobacterium TaxID=33986 RepID=UPI001AE55216|nr:MULTISPECIES: chloride channel protein [Exiguobacterium]MCT4779608.1 chloride channel protein [Exiguobacterium soli]